MDNTHKRVLKSLLIQKYGEYYESKLNEIEPIVEEFMEKLHDYLDNEQQEDVNKQASEVFPKFIEYCFYRNVANFDTMILLTSDKGCVTEDTKIDMPRDFELYPQGVPVSELIGKTNFYVYSFNPNTNKIELRKAKGCEFAKEDDVYEVKFAHGIKVKCTIDHPFMTTEGKLVQLKDLIWHDYGRYKKNIKITPRRGLNEIEEVKEDRVRIIVRRSNFLKTDYNRINPVPKYNEKRFLAEQVLGRELEDNKIVRAENGDKNDLRLENLEIIDKKDLGNNYKVNNPFLNNKPKVNEDFVELTKQDRNLINYGSDIKSIKYVGKKKVYDIIGVENNANFIANKIVVGNTGKSSAAIEMGRKWCKLVGKKFDPDKYIAYTNKQVQEKLDTLDMFDPLICDESINFASSENWNKAENKELKKQMGKIRTKHLFFVLCFPLKIKKLDKVYLESYVNYWIDLFARGVGALYVKDKNPFYDSWRMKQFEKIGSYTEFTPLRIVRDRLSAHPNFWHIVKFPKPSEEMYKKYVDIREQNVYNEASAWGSIDQNDIARAVLINTLKDIISKDSSLSVKRLLMHLSNEYGIDLNKQTFDNIVKDSEMLINKVKSEKNQIRI